MQQSFTEGSFLLRGLQDKSGQLLPHDWFVVLAQSLPKASNPCANVLHGETVMTFASFKSCKTMPPLNLMSRVSDAEESAYQLCSR